MPTLFDPISMGALLLKNRLIMSPMTRARATRDHVPTPMMAEYYRQRAGAGLLITEATGISQEGLGWPFAPGIWSPSQIEAWKPVTDAVHDAGGLTVVQLWHMGRLVHPSFLGGRLPVSASAGTAPDLAHTYDGKQPYTEARALTITEIERIVADYGTAARNALAAGFDGIELHGANGYLIDQFLRNSCNQRNDIYGGSVENRLRFLREVVNAVSAEIGADRVGVRLSPNGEIQGVTDSDPEPLFTAAAQALDVANIAFLELRERRPDGTFGRSDQPLQAANMRRHFHNSLILNGDFDEERARRAVMEAKADAVSFGRPFISNPDLPHRFLRKLPLSPPAGAEIWYGQTTRGYTDFASATA